MSSALEHKYSATIPYSCKTTLRMKNERLENHEEIHSSLQVFELLMNFLHEKHAITKMNSDKRAEKRNVYENVER